MVLPRFCTETKVSACEGSPEFRNQFFGI
jgi:hypothetical protein